MLQPRLQVWHSSLKLASVHHSNIIMQQTFGDIQWTGHHLQGQTPAIMVKYKSPTLNKPSAWIATLKRDRTTIYRVTSPYSDGPIVAAQKCLDESGLGLILSSAHTLDPIDNIYIFATSLR